MMDFLNVEGSTWTGISGNCTNHNQFRNIILEREESQGRIRKLGGKRTSVIVINIDSTLATVKARVTLDGVLEKIGL